MHGHCDNDCTGIFSNIQAVSGRKRVRRKPAASRAKWLALAGAAIAGVHLSNPASSLAATTFLDLNGTTSGFGGPSGSADQSTTLTWTTDTTGVAAPAAFSLANVMQIGNVASDFSGGTIALSLNNANNWTGSSATTGITVVSNNVILNTTVNGNIRYNHAFQWSVAAGSTMNLIRGTSDFNFNNQAATMAGGGIINFTGALSNNETTGVITENMVGGILKLNQTGTLHIRKRYRLGFHIDRWHVAVRIDAVVRRYLSSIPYCRQQSLVQRRHDRQPHRFSRHDRHGQRHLQLRWRFHFHRHQQPEPWKRRGRPDRHSADHC